MRFLVTSVLPLDIQFEDIDAGGFVHHPNYLRFIERGRYAGVRALNLGFEEQLRSGATFVVAETATRYLTPLAMGQRAFVLTRTVAMRKSSLKILQSIVLKEPDASSLERAGDSIFSLPGAAFLAQLRLVYVDLRTLKPVEIPVVMRSALGVSEELPPNRRDTQVRSWSEFGGERGSDEQVSVRA